MLNACSKEAPRVRKCYKPMLHLFSFNRTARPARRNGPERPGRGRGARQDAPPPAGARGTGVSRHSLPRVFSPSCVDPRDALSSDVDVRSRRHPLSRTRGCATLQSASFI